MINRVTGLRGMGDRPTSGTPNRARAGAPNPNEMRRPALRPTANPVDTYARPQAPSASNDLLQFAEALGQISPSLNTLLDNEAKARREAAENRAASRLGGMTYEEHRSFVQQGGAEMEDPWFRAAAMRLFGERQALYRSNQLAHDYATSFDVENGNIDEFVSAGIAEDLEQWGNDPHFMGAYTPTMDGFRGRAYSQHTADVSEIAVNQARDGIYETFLGTAQLMRENGASPEDILGILHHRYEGNRNLLNVPYQDQDTELVRVAEAFAQAGDLDMVNALLNTPRTGADGVVSGALSENRNFAAQAAQIVTRATTEMESRNQEASLAAQMRFDEVARLGTLDVDELLEFHQANPGAVTAAQVRSWVTTSNGVVAQAQHQAARAQAEAALQRQAFDDRNGVRLNNLGLVDSNRVAFIQDATVRNDQGEPTVITVAQQQQWLVEDINRNIEVARDQHGLDDQQVFDLRVGQFTMAGLNNPEWESVLASGPIAATAWSLSGEPPATLVEGAELYMQLYEKSPMLLQRHIKDAEVRRFYETYRTAVTLGRMEPSQAYSHAANIMREPAVSNPLSAPSANALRAAVRNIGNGSAWFNPTAWGTANNESYVTDWINRQANDYAAMGTMNGDRAVQEAEREFHERHTNINGQWVDTSDRHVPPNFEELARTVLEDYARDFPDEVPDPSDLTLQAGANGTWEIIYLGAVPLPVEDPSRRYITMHDMQVAVDARSIIAQEALQQTQQEHQRLQVEQGQAREQGYLQVQNEPGVYYLPRQFGRYRAVYAEGSDTPTFELIEGSDDQFIF